jgi:arabinogalactan endo-1,4-beta-galactosidase
MKHLVPAASLLLAAALHAASPAPDQPFAGVDANYSLGMEAKGMKWLWSGTQGNLFKGMAAHGVRGFRVRLWTKDDGQNGKRYATEVVKRALAAGLEPYLVIFLSEDWADLMKQPAPAPWKNLDLEKRAEAVKAYSRDVVADFRKAGLRNHLYEIGNEIDYGICGVYPGKSTKKTPESLSRSCWPDATKLIRASQAGVLEADPDAKFMLHIAHWWDVKFVVAFFEFMLANGVRVDFAGLSYFPSSNIGGSLEMAQLGAVIDTLHAAIRRPVIIPETAYPGTPDFKGQFSRWKREVPGYSLTPDGQERWLRDFLDFCARHPAVASVYYWSPEWCGEGMWKGMALFDPTGEARPAWSAFTPASRAERATPRVSAFFEARDGKLHAVPVGAARERSAAIVAEKLGKFGRVNMDYINEITATPLAVDGYDVALRASISGNLDLTLRADAPAVDPKSAVAKLDPAAQRLVLFAADPSDPVIAKVTTIAKERGVKLVVHPINQEKPLKFGLAPALPAEEEPE